MKFALERGESLCRAFYPEELTELAGQRPQNDQRYLRQRSDRVTERSAPIRPRQTRRQASVRR